MAKKTSVSKKQEGHVGDGKSERVAFRGYINYTPTADDKERLLSLVASGSSPLDQLADVLLQGYRCGVTWDSYHQCFTASLYDQDADRPTSGYNLGARANDPYSALTRILFLHVHVFEGNWLQAVDRQREQDNW